MISIGDRLDNKYLITRWLGGGGFGDVFLANDEGILHRQVAIKALKQPREGNQSDLDWEMQALAQFNHPHVVGFYHYFTDANRLHLVMEFCPGGSLHDRLVVERCCTTEQVFAWGLELCEALAYVHTKGIVHHDIKPLNIFFAGDETIKLGDFGVANRHAGTPLYLPPEVLDGERVSRNDPRVDLYALGLTLLEALMGRHPFRDLPPDQARRIRRVHGFVPTDLPRWVQEVLLKVTHPTPELRFQTAEDFAEAIRAKHVSYVFDRNRIKADTLAKRAEAEIARRKWKRAETLASFALKSSPDSVAALLAAGRCQLMLRRIDKARESFLKAVSINPRAPVQKELGWMHMEQGRVATAISMLTDHLQRNASDFEAYNLLLKCFYLTDRLEAAESLAQTLIDEKVPSQCFRNNQILCRLLSGRDYTITPNASIDPFVTYNLRVAAESPTARDAMRAKSLKSKLLFQEYRFGTVRLDRRQNTIAVYSPDGARHDISQPIVTIGSLSANDLVLRDRSVSRRHCVIVNFSDDVWLYDLGSTWGTVVAGTRLAGDVFLDGVHEVAVGNVQIRIAARSDLLV